jgi:plasmid maintenance system antidote protein VapI
MTPNTALRLARYFGNTPAFWMNLQLRWDLYFAQQADKKVLEGIQPYRPPLAGD